MKQFGYVFVLALILGCQGVAPSIAGDAKMGSALLQSSKGIQAQSAEPTRSTTQFQNIEGMLKEIQGNVYLVEGAAAQEPIRVEIGQDTAFPNGQKEPGQLLQALISTSDGHALIIR